MESVVLVVIVAVVVAAVVKYRSQASKERSEVLARMRTEHEIRGDFSPTAELFREVGAPVGAVARPSSAGATMPLAAPGSVPVSTTPLLLPTQPPIAATPPVPAGTDTGTVAPDLAVMFQGIQMPAGLAPLGEMSPTLVTFVSPAPARDVQPALAAELIRIGADVAWPEPTVAQVRRRGRLAALTVYPRPDLAVDLDGARLFPHAPADSCVVRLALV